MRLWNGMILYAPRTPEYYAIPGYSHCMFRVMQKHGDVQAWNLFWLTRPGIDLIPLKQDNWRTCFTPFTEDEVRAFYAALDTSVINKLPLSHIMAQPPREALRLLKQAKLENTDFYHLAGGEQWRETMLGRLFLAERLK
jgi:hypothetical protein